VAGIGMWKVPLMHLHQDQLALAEPSPTQALMISDRLRTMVAPIAH
jgi:hypothetical protein